MTHSKLHQTLALATSKLLHPLIRLMLRYGIGYQAFCEMTKRAYIEVARSQFQIEGKKQTVSRIATLTGLSRKEVSRVSQIPPTESVLGEVAINRGARVIAGWTMDKRFLDEKGQPVDLAFDGQNSFATLVKKYSGDIPPRAIADELTRTGAASQLPNGSLRLVRRAYLTRADELQGIELLGADTADLIASISHNLQLSEQPFFQRKVCYRNIDPECLMELRQILNEKAQEQLEDLQREIHQQAKVAAGEDKVRLGIGIYYFEDLERGE